MADPELLLQGRAHPFGRGVRDRWFDGLGQYDVMAMGALYGRVLETFDPSTVSAQAQYDLEPMVGAQTSDDWFTNSGLVHYTELARRIDVFNKSDLAPGFRPPPGALLVSAKTGEGMEELRRAMLAAAGWSGSGESVFLARERHLRALTSAQAHLERAGLELPRWELFAEELRLAHEALGEITGRFTSEDLLGEIFGRFCIGK